METILTGIRVNSEMTMANYLGALLPMVRLANQHSKDYLVNIFVPDLHTITDEIKGDLTKNAIRSIKYYLAAGLELNDNVHFYRQSKVPAHTELFWIFNCITSMGELSRMTQYKDKSTKNGANLGIFTYPVLMAADILLYSARYVPVGEDQFQHLELTRDLAMRFNARFGEILVSPEKTKKQVEFMGLDEGIRIRDLMNPEKKMSKSAESENSRIMMSDLPMVAYKKIMSSTTDSKGKINYDFKNQPGISNLLQIEAIIKGVKIEEVTKEWQDREKYGVLKKTVGATVSEFLTKIQEEIAKIEDEKVIELLEVGEEWARGVAGKKLAEIKAAIGL